MRAARLAFLTLAASALLQPPLRAAAPADPAAAGAEATRSRAPWNRQVSRLIGEEIVAWRQAVVAQRPSVGIAAQALDSPVSDLSYQRATKPESDRVIPIPSQCAMTNFCGTAQS